MAWDRGDDWTCFLDSALLVQAGELRAYQRACRRMLERVSKWADPRVAERIAKTCALAPSAVVDFERVVALAERAVQEEPSNRLTLLTRGLVEHRAGRFDRAVAWLMCVAPRAGGDSVDALAFAVLALVHDRRCERDQARAALSKAQAILAHKMPRPEEGQNFGADWHDWLRSQILCREAEQRLVQAPNMPPAERQAQNPAGTGNVTFFVVVERSYQIGDVGRFPKVNPLAQSYRLKTLATDYGYTCLCLKVRKDGAIVARVRQVDSVSSHTGRGDGLGAHFSRSFIVRGIDTEGLKDRSVWDPGDTEFKVVGTERDKAGAQLLVFEPADPAKVKKPAAHKEEKAEAEPKEDREAVAKQKLDFAEGVMQRSPAESGEARDLLEDLARSRLEEVVKKYPGTRAAKRAQELLNT
jgi:hypothetical protein